MPKMKKTKLPKPVAPRLRQFLICEDRGDFYTFASIAFDLAALAWKKGEYIPDYSPGAGGPCLSEIDIHRKELARGLSGKTIARLSCLSWRIFKMKEERSDRKRMEEREARLNQVKP